MSILDDLKNILKKDIKSCDDYLTKTANLVKHAPSIQRKKEEKETNLKIIEGLPVDIAEELAPILLSSEMNDDTFRKLTPKLPDISPFFIRSIENTSGSSSAYIAISTGVILDYGSPVNRSEWTEDVLSTISQYTKKIQQQEYLPARLDKINLKLGKMYLVAYESFIKSQKTILGVDQAAIQMRDVLDQTWGGLLNIAREKNKNKRIEVSALAFRKENDRKELACILTNEIFSNKRLIELLDDAYSLYRKLSDTKFGKNPLIEDNETLKIYYYQWIAFLDGISGIVES